MVSCPKNMDTGQAVSAFTAKNNKQSCTRQLALIKHLHKDNCINTANWKRGRWGSGGTGGWWRGRKTGPTELPYRRQLRQPAQREEKRGKTERERGQETLNRCVKPSSAFLLGNARSGAAGRQYEDYLGSLCARCVLIRRLPSQLIRSACGSSETSKQVDSWQEFSSGLAQSPARLPAL